MYVRARSFAGGASPPHRLTLTHPELQTSLEVLAVGLASHRASEKA